MTRALQSRVSRLEAKAPDALGGIAVIIARSRSGEDALIAEASRRREIQHNDLVVVVCRFGPGADTSDFQPIRIAGGRTTAILEGFCEPLGLPWLDEVDLATVVAAGHG